MMKHEEHETRQKFRCKLLKKSSTEHSNQYSLHVGARMFSRTGPLVLPQETRTKLEGSRPQEGGKSDNKPTVFGNRCSTRLPFSEPSVPINLRRTCRICFVTNVKPGECV